LLGSPEVDQGLSLLKSTVQLTILSPDLTGGVVATAPFTPRDLEYSLLLVTIQEKWKFGPALLQVLAAAVTELDQELGIEESF